MEKLLPLYLKQIRSCLIITDLQGIIKYSNNLCENLFGSNPHDVIGKNISFLLPNIKEDIIKTIIQNEHYYSSFDQRGKDNSRINILVNACLIKSDNSEPNEIIFILNTLEKLGKVFNNNNFDNDFMKESYYITRGLVHGILSPVMDIENSIDTINYPDNPDILEAKSNINGAIKTIIRKLSYLISFGGFDLELFENVDLKELINEILEIYENLYKKLIVKVNSSNGDLYIKGIKELISTALKNIINNSVEAMNYQGDLSITLEQKDKNTVITIKDSGGGIPDKIYDNIFEGITTKEGGHGRGIVDSVEIIHLFSGDLKINNYPGKGAEFIFYFPISPK